MENWFNVGLGILQIVILIFQCNVAIWEYINRKGEKKGILQISYTNITDKRYEHSRFDWEYNLNELVSFKNIGDDFVRIYETRIIVDGNERYNNIVPNGISLSNIGEFCTYSIDFQLSETERRKEKINVMLIVCMRNSMNYKYRQKVEMLFEKVRDNCWRMKKYDWKVNKRR